jgi:hypothetical protein
MLCDGSSGAACLEVLKTTVNNPNNPPNSAFNRLALPSFDYNFNTLYTGMVVDGSPTSIGFYANQHQHNDAPNNEKGQSDFKDAYHDSLDDSSGMDQTHHLAYHFSAGLNGAVLSSYLQKVDDALPGARNPGDLALTDAAYAFGMKLRNDPNLMTKIGERFKNEFCK